MAYSGGKDSTYALLTLARKYGMKILTLTFDNGFISPRALQNIFYITDILGATSMVVRPSFEVMKKVFKLAAEKEFFSPQALDRASSICTTCIGFVKSLVLKTALQMHIPLAAYGWSPGQAPITSAIMQTSPRIQAITNRTMRDPLFNLFPDELKAFFYPTRIFPQWLVHEMGARQLSISRNQYKSYFLKKYIDDCATLRGTLQG